MSKIEILEEEAINLVKFKNLNIGDYFIYENVLYIKCIESTSVEFFMRFNAISLYKGCIMCFKEDVEVKVVDVKIMYN